LHVPVIYAIEFEVDIFENRIFNAGEVRTSRVIPASSIVAEITFPNGAENMGPTGDKQLIQDIGRFQAIMENAKPK
jgi:hypothetical protein